MLKNLRLLREEKNISQKLLADKLGVSQQSVNKYENHSVEPDFATLCKMADYFGTTTDFLLGRTEARLPTVPPASFGLTNEEFSLLQGYRQLTDRQKSCLQLLVETYNEKL